jgi:hypothetical protein
LLTEMELRLVANEGNHNSGSAAEPVFPAAQPVRHQRPPEIEDRLDQLRNPQSGAVGYRENRYPHPAFNDTGSSGNGLHGDFMKSKVNFSRWVRDIGIRLEPVSGNFCGGGYGGGETGGNPFDPSVSPVDQFDRTCQIHDQNFDGKGSIADYWANRELVENINRLRNDPGSDWNNGEMNWIDQFYANRAHGHFAKKVEDFREQYGVPRGGGPRGW